MEIIKRPSTHFGERENGARPSFLIIHYTETKNLEDAEDYFLGRREHPNSTEDKKERVSTHYMIDEDGTIVQYVDEDKRAWHAGLSYWAGIKDINSHSIGIELVNPGRKYGYRAFPVKQMEALVRLCKDIMSRNTISPFRVLGHSDIAPGRKSDPGELFDWKMLASAGIGVFPKPNEDDFRVARDYVRDESCLREAFTMAGYDPSIDLKIIIKDFQRHYYPEAFADQDIEQVGRINETAAARLHWLIRNRPNL